MKKLEIYEYQAKEIKDALRLAYRALECHKLDTSMDRSISQAYLIIQNVLDGQSDRVVLRSQLASQFKNKKKE